MKYLIPIFCIALAGLGSMGGLGDAIARSLSQNVTDAVATTAKVGATEAQVSSGSQAAGVRAFLSGALTHAINARGVHKGAITTKRGGVAVHVHLPDAALHARPKDGYPVHALFSGYMGQSGAYKDVIQSHLDRGVAVAAVDLPDTFDPNLGNRHRWGARALDLVEEQAADHGLIDANRLSAGGHSMGGALSIILGGLDPRVKSVVAIAPGHGPTVPMNWMRPGKSKRTHELVEAAMEQLSRSNKQVMILEASNDGVVGGYGSYMHSRIEQLASRAKIRFENKAGLHADGPFHYQESQGRVSTLRVIEGATHSPIANTDVTVGSHSFEVMGSAPGHLSGRTQRNIVGEFSTDHVLDTVPPPR